MTFLPHSAFFTGSLADACPGSLLLSRGNNLLDFLIGESKGQKIAVALDGGNWRSFECSGNHSYYGIVISDIYFEVDVSPEGEISETEYGYLVGQGDTISIMSRPSVIAGGVEHLIPLVTGILGEVGGMSQSFRTWRVCWGSDANRQILYEPPKILPDK